MKIKVYTYFVVPNNVHKHSKKTIIIIINTAGEIDSWKHDSFFGGI